MLAVQTTLSEQNFGIKIMQIGLGISNAHKKGDEILIRSIDFNKLLTKISIFEKVGAGL